VPMPSGPTMDEPAAGFDGLWRSLSSTGRAGWLAAAYARWFACPSLWPQKPAGTVIDLDGRVIDGLASLFCAMGEAVNGPAGYFGRNVNGFADCVIGGFGVTPPWALRWHHSETSRQTLGHEETIRYQRDLLESGVFPDDATRAAVAVELDTFLRDRHPTLFDTIVSILRERGVAVELR